MNILVIGNGFDLAHGLPTKYEHFLKYVEEYKRFINPSREEFVEENEQLVRLGQDFTRHFETLYDNHREIFNEFGKLVSNNVLLNYFCQIKKNRILAGKDGWIDFESEISVIIQTLDSARVTIIEEIEHGNEHGKMTQQQWKVLAPIWGRTDISEKSIKFDETAVGYKKKRLLDNLNELTRCLEIYLEYYVERLPCTVRLPDIDKIEIQRVLSFNYTHTYERLYHTDKSKLIEYDYIHGDAKPDSNVIACNMVLGIDEYLDGNARNRENVFVEFKKFYQRIYKRTGCKYVDWIANAKHFSKVNKAYSEGWPNNVYIMGHSLDITDKDILASLIRMEDTKTTIFYHNQEALGNQISNLVKVLGEDELISKVHGKDARIVFQLQQEAVPFKT